MNLVIATDKTKGTDLAVQTATKDLLKALLKSYDLSPTGANIGLLSYGNAAREVLVPRSGYNREVIEQYIDQVAYEDGPRDVEGAVSSAYNMLVAPSYTRRFARKQLLLTILGGSVNSRSLEVLSSQLRRSNIRPIIFAVNVPNARTLLPLVEESEDLIVVEDTELIGSSLGKIEERSGKNAGKKFFISNDIIKDISQHKVS